MNTAPQQRRTSASPSGLRDRRPILWHIPVSHYSEKVRCVLRLEGRSIGDSTAIIAALERQ